MKCDLVLVDAPVRAEVQRLHAALSRARSRLALERKIATGLMRLQHEELDEERERRREAEQALAESLAEQHRLQGVIADLRERSDAQSEGV